LLFLLCHNQTKKPRYHWRRFKEAQRWFFLPEAQLNSPFRVFLLPEPHFAPLVSLLATGFHSKQGISGNFVGFLGFNL
jgi:hypothetical protein